MCKGRTRSERVRARAEVKERLVVSSSRAGMAGAVGEEAPEEMQTNGAAADGVQLMQEVVQVNVSQNGDEVIVEEVLNNSVVEVAPDDSIEVVMEAHNPVIDLTEAEDEVVLVEDTGIESKTKVEIDLTSSPMPAPGPPPMQCPVCCLANIRQ